ncbi:MAG: TonB-dependent receptor [Deltaproteobacteria bacterium]|nr:TonB-dependent receptor [Deltaproteobacteria bacterium]
MKIISVMAALLFIASPCFAVVLAELESKTTAELLLYYDWEELLVETPTRRPTRLRHVAENMSVITAEEIRAMNAHSVNEILRTVTGVRVAFRGGDFGGMAALSIHGSDYEHVLILLDGVRLNDVDSGWPETGGIPVQIIDRIEVLKGPSSSAWGSALGGVINIVTKPAGSGNRPTGTLYGSQGEGNSREYRAEAAAGHGKQGYYLYGGSMDSDGLVGDKYFENKSFYGKFASALTEKVAVTFTAGYWHPDYKDFEWAAYDRSYLSDIKNYLVTGKLEAGLSSALRLSLDLYFLGQERQNSFETMTSGAHLESRLLDNGLYGGSSSLTWEQGNHTLLLGMDLSRGENDSSYFFATAAPVEWGTETRKEWAVYLNDTLRLDKLSVTPGLRYDHLSIAGAATDDIVSPSLGLTYPIDEQTLLRATAARGFIRPAIGLVVGTPGYAGYPDLEPEDIWSLQAGIESSRFRNLHLKADIFYHHQDESWFLNDEAGLFTNGGESERTGFELGAATSPLDNLTAGCSFTYVRLEPYGGISDDAYGLNLKLQYQAGRLGNLLLIGYYRWLDANEASTGASYDDMIWDLHYNKDIFVTENTTTNFFVSARNLFNGRHYWHYVFENPDRWLEAGLRIAF